MINKLPIDDVHITALSGGADFAEIFAEETTSTSILHENKRIERASRGIDAGFGVRAIYGERTAYGFTNDPSKLLDVAASVAQKNNSVAPAKMGASLKSLDPHFYGSDTHCDDLPVASVTKASETAWLASPDIKQVQTIWRDSLRRIWVVNSRGLSVSNEKRDTVMVVHVTAGKDGQIQTGYEPANGKDIDPVAVAEAAARRALLMLSARHAPSGVMPVVISSSAGGTMIHEAVGHGMEADLACQNMSVYAGKMGKQVASKLITVVDDATIKRQRGSFTFDDEGNMAHRTVLIDHGILKNYMHNMMTAKKAGTISTGNGRRESYRNRPVVRMTNTLVTPGHDDPEKIIASVKDGLLVKKMGGGQVNTLNGDFVFEAQEAYLIKDGKVSEPVRGATLIGNGPKILMDIDMVGTDIGYGIGTCGKEGQGVPVGHGMPTIRIPSITVGGQA